MTSIEKYITELNKTCDADTIEQNYSTHGLTYVQNEIHRVESILREFIASVGGTIKNVIYPGLRDRSNINKRVDIADLVYIMHSYKEYNEGMKIFIEKACSVFVNSEVEDVDKNNMLRKLNIALERDVDYISACAAENDNSPMTLEEAFQNVEVIVDFFELFDYFNTCATELWDCIVDEGVEGRDSTLLAFKLYGNSTIRFLNFMATHIINSYVMVQETILKKSGNTEDMIEYALF